MSILTKNEKGEPSIRTTVGMTLTEIEMKKLKAISIKKERSVSWLVSKAVSNYLSEIDLSKLK